MEIIFLAPVPSPDVSAPPPLLVNQAPARLSQPEAHRGSFLSGHELKSGLGPRIHRPLCDVLDVTSN
eukprot:751004-Hanusia_phi.AAC.2